MTKKKMVIAILGIAVLAIVGIIIGVCVKNSKPNVPIDTLYKREGDCVLFGTFPQTIKDDSISIDKKKSKMLGSFLCYLGSDNEWYVEVAAQPEEEYYRYTNTIQVKQDNVAYFKIEPLRWKVIKSEEEGLVLICDSIIFNISFGKNGVSTSDGANVKYSASRVREWLNNDFYSIAFDDNQKKIIKTTLVNNGRETYFNDYDLECENTKDKICLPSYKDVINEDYGFSTLASRQKVTTDFSRATGAYMYHNESFYGMGRWITRTPKAYFLIECVGHDGDCGGIQTDKSSSGIVPMLFMKTK